MKFTLETGKKGLRIRRKILNASGFQHEEALDVFAENGRLTVSVTDAPDLRDVPPEMLDLLRQSGVCLDALEELMIEEAYQALGLFGPEHCDGNPFKLDYEGKVLVLSPDALRAAGCPPGLYRRHRLAFHHRTEAPLPRGTRRFFFSPGPEVPGGCPSGRRTQDHGTHPLGSAAIGSPRRDLRRFQIKTKRSNDYVQESQSRTRRRP